MVFLGKMQKACPPCDVLAYAQCDALGATGSKKARSSHYCPCNCPCIYRLTAAEAHSAGLVSRVVSSDKLMPEARSMARSIASLSSIAIAKAKDCINRAYEIPLSEGLRYEQ